MRVKLTKEQKIKVLNSFDVYAIMQQILLRENKIGRSKEHFWGRLPVVQQQDTAHRADQPGERHKSIVDPTEVFSFALQKRAVKVIMAHNHPSGELQPSMEDKDITDRMYRVGLFRDVPVIDHLIISETAYYSFVDTGLLAKLSKSKKYVLKFKKEEERIKKLGRKEGEKIGELRKAIQMAKGMKVVGIDIEIIAKLSGLTEEQIEKL